MLFINWALLQRVCLFIKQCWAFFFLGKTKHNVFFYLTMPDFFVNSTCYVMYYCVCSRSLLLQTTFLKGLIKVYSIMNFNHPMMSYSECFGAVWTRASYKCKVDEHNKRLRVCWVTIEFESQHIMTDYFVCLLVFFEQVSLCTLAKLSCWAADTTSVTTSHL